MKQGLKADLALGFCSLIWGATFVVVKEALDHASVFAFLAVRFSVAALLMLAIYAARLKTFTGSAVWAGVKIGLLMFGGYAFQTLGLQFTTPSKAGFLTGTSVVLIPIFLALFWRRHINHWVWAGAMAALLGMYLLAVPREGIAGLNVGDPLVFLCAVVWAFHIILVGQYSARHSVAALSLVQVAATAVLSILAVPLVGVTGWEPFRLTWSGQLVWAVGITAVGATAAAFTLQVWAQKYASPTHTAILFSLEPVFAAITSYIVLHERLGGRALLGCGLILAGIVLAELKGPTQAAPESPTAMPEIPGH